MASPLFVFPHKSSSPSFSSSSSPSSSSSSSSKPPPLTSSPSSLSLSSSSLPPSSSSSPSPGSTITSAYFSSSSSSPAPTSRFQLFKLSRVIGVKMVKRKQTGNSFSDTDSLSEEAKGGAAQSAARRPTQSPPTTVLSSSLASQASQGTVYPPGSYQPGSSQYSGYVQKSFGRSLLSSLSTGFSAASGAGSSGQSLLDIDPSDVQVRLFASAGCVGHAFVAVVCSNEHVIIRYVGDSGFPVVRQLVWHRDAQKKIVAIDFNPTAEWLSIVTADFSIYLLPVFSLLSQVDNTFQAPAESAQPAAATRDSMRPIGIPAENKAAPGPDLRASFSYEQKQTDMRASFSQHDWFGRLPSLMNYALESPPMDDSSLDGDLGSQSDLTLLHQGSRSKYGQVAQCLWWKTCNGVDILILGTVQGNVVFVNLRNKLEVCHAKLKFGVSKMELVEDSIQSYKYLLLQLSNGSFWRLLVEQQNDEYHTYDTILTNVGKPSFVPTPFERFPAGTRLSAQRSKQGPLIGVFHSQSNKFEVYDLEFNKYALFVYQLFPEISHLLLTDRFIFAVSPASPEVSKVSVISNLAAGTSANPLQFLKQMKESIMQEFLLPKGEVVRGFLRSFPVSRMVATRNSAGTDDVPLEGCILVTSKGVYELRAHLPPKSIFFSLLEASDKKEAEVLGKTLQLDLYQLYETAADQQFREGHPDKALELYLMSNVKTSKIVEVYQGIDRSDVVLKHLHDVLKDLESLTVAERKKYSDIMLKIYTQRLLARETTEPKGPRDNSSPAPLALNQLDMTLLAEFQKFLLENKDYDSGVALVEFVKYGWMDLFFEVAHCRKQVPAALTILANRGVLHLTKAHMKFLIKHGHTASLKACSGGVILRCLSPNDQIDLLLSDQGSGSVGYYTLLHLIPELDEKRLRKVTRYLEPLLSVKLRKPSVHVSRSDHSREPSFDEKEEQAAPLRHEDAAEVYLTVLIILEVRKRENARSEEPVKRVNFMLSASPEADSPAAAAAAVAAASPSSGDHSPTPTSWKTASSISPASPSYPRNPKLSKPVPTRAVTVQGSSRRVSRRISVPHTLKLDKASAGPKAEESHGGEPDDLDLPSGDSLLSKQLQQLFGSYLPTSLINTAIRWKDWITVAEIYEHMKDWPQALEYRLQSLQLYFSREEFDFEGRNELECSLDVLSSFIWRLKKVPPAASVLMMVMILQHWKGRMLPVPALETFLLQYLELVAVPLGILIGHSHQDDAQPLPQEVVGCTPKFSPLFYLEITKKRLEILAAEHAQSHNNKVPVERLWSEITTNLEKDLEKRSKVSIPNLALLSRLAPKAPLANTSEKDTIAFTCGHFFPRRDFVDSLLPEFTKRMEKLPVSLGLSGKILVSDYFKHQMDHSCPVCLFNGLRQECLKISADSPTPMWTL